MKKFLFDKPENIILPNDLTKEIIFSKRAAEESYKRYRDSNQCDKQKINKDHFTGILGELSVYLLYRKKGVFLINKTGHAGPNYTIYYGRDNAWDKDLYYNGIGFSVKTQAVSDANRDNIYAWIFQSVPNGRSDPIVTNKNSWIIFVTLDDTTTPMTATIYPAYQTKDLKFTEEPIQKHLIGKKIAVMLKDLPCNKIYYNIEDAWDR